MKFTVTFSRTVNLGKYNSMRLELTENFDTSTTTHEEAFGKVRSFVYEKLEQEVNYNGAMMSYENYPHK